MVTVGKSTEHDLVFSNKTQGAGKEMWEAIAD
jgi:hypothetical protein